MGATLSRLQGALQERAFGGNGDDVSSFTFVRSDGHHLRVGHRDLAQRALGLAGALQAEAVGTHVFIVLPHGEDYAVALLACIAANVAAVPLALAGSALSPQEAERVRALQAQLDLHGPALLLTDAATQRLLAAEGLCADRRCMIVGEPITGPVPLRPAAETDIAVVLFTSGSTASSKGIPLSHRNLWLQIEAGRRQWAMTADSHVATWMSPSHNFGLHFGLLVPFVVGGSSTYLSSNDFLKRPGVWLETAAQVRATHLCAPNFAFEVCCDAKAAGGLRPEALAGVEAVVCGGEPVRASTMKRFLVHCAAAGLRPETFRAHYGMSEVGALATWEPGCGEPFLELDGEALREGRIASAQADRPSSWVANCGAVADGVTLQIVAVDTGRPCAEGEMGEIQIQSPALALGYLGAGAGTSGAWPDALLDTGANGFFRTGDLGFLRAGCLHVAGREKDLLIVRGKNHFPSDIEATMAAILPSDASSPVVFGSDGDAAAEAVCAAVEFGGAVGEAACSAWTTEVRRRVAEVHGLALSRLLLVAPGEVRRLSPGKLKRRLIREAAANGGLTVRWQDGVAAARSGAAVSPEATDAVIARLRDRAFVTVLGPVALQLSADAFFADAGLDSFQCIRIAGEIEAEFGVPFQATQLFRYKTLRELSTHLQNAGGPTVDAATSRAPADASESEPIAIVGLHCEFGPVADAEALWRLLIDGGEAIESIEQARPALWRAMNAYPGLRPERLPRRAGLLRDVEAFDAAFFGISRREAECMDPQQRKMLEFVWTLSEAAGHDPRSLSGQPIGLFVGVHNSDYGELLAARHDLMAEYGAYIDSGAHMSMVPNRVSRWFNISGPSEAVNTACSSSLVAVYRAVEALRRGECRSAIAAGVNLILTPRVLLSSADAGMLAPDGRCKTLDANADGFVRAEGIAGIWLKPLSAAQADGDVIHGLLRGATVNHDGRSNSLRAPNAAAQKALIVSAYRRAQVDPATVSYVELHGTGTRLGDPIEVQALQEAFRELGDASTAGHCGIGSIKSNIGHAESAAGMAGLIKVLLSLRHQQLPATRHVQQLNPLLSLDGSPFSAVLRHRDWPAENDGAQPRRAGISSFGFGGVNAHAIVEAYRPALRPSCAPAPAAHAIVLSARTPDQLQQLMQRMLAFVQRTDADKALTLADFAYTLQVGRAALEHRIAFEAKTLDELASMLGRALDGEESIPGVWRGHAGAAGAAIRELDAEGDLAALIPRWMAAGRVGRVLSLWVQGFCVDWASLYVAGKPRRAVLPTYPFSKDIYWLPAVEVPATRGGSGREHELLHRNTSSLAGQRFTSAFSGKEFFLADHVIGGCRTLPGAVQLEMARLAVKRSAELQEGEDVELFDVVFAQPAVADSDGLELHVVLLQRDDGVIEYRLVSGCETTETLHGQGRARCVRPMLHAQEARLPWPRVGERLATGEACRESLALHGVHNGPAMHGLQAVYRVEPGEGGGLLARLALPASMPASTEPYGLHPSLLDAALQASSLLGESGNHSLRLPFSVDRLRLHRTLPSPAWAWVRQSDDVRSGNLCVDILLADDGGAVCAELLGLRLRAQAPAQDASALDVVFIIVLIVSL